MVTQAHPVKDERSIGELFSELSRETSTLVRQEVALAKAEVTQKARSIGKDVAFMAIGGALAYAGLLVMIAVVIILFAKAIPWWASTLLVGAIVTGLGGYLVMSGMKALQHEDIAPRQTIDTLREDVEWAKRQTK